MENELKTMDCQRPYQKPETVVHKFEIKSCLMVASTQCTETETGGMEFVFD